MRDEERLERSKKAVGEIKRRQPNFHIGEYQIRTDGISFWFVDKNGIVVTGYHQNITKGLLNELRHIMVHEQDLSGEIDEFLEKFTKARKETNRSFNKAVREIKLSLKEKAMIEEMKDTINELRSFIGSNKKA